MALRLTLAFCDKPRLQPLKDGTVKPQNIDLECPTLDASELFQLVCWERSHPGRFLSRRDAGAPRNPHVLSLCTSLSTTSGCGSNCEPSESPAPPERR